jgi:hypothetical protein
VGRVGNGCGRRLLTFASEAVAEFDIAVKVVILGRAAVWIEVAVGLRARDRCQREKQHERGGTALHRVHVGLTTSERQPKSCLKRTPRWHSGAA